MNNLPTSTAAQGHASPNGIAAFPYHKSHGPTKPTRSNAVFAPVARSGRNMPGPLDVQSEPKKLLLLAPARYQHDGPDRRAAERVFILSIGAFAQFVVWNLHLKRGFGLTVGETELHDSAPSAFSNPILGCAFFSFGHGCRRWEVNTYD